MLPSILRFSIRMSDADDNWNTDKIWEIRSFSKKRENNKNQDYLKCFMFIQNALEQEFIRTKSKAVKTTIPDVEFRSFPFPEVERPTLIAEFLPLCIVFSFFYSFLCTIKVRQSIV